MVERKGATDVATNLAYRRTFFAAERTQMAWIRTSLALISFGFGIAKFFQYLNQTQGKDAPALGPRTVGMVMISIGLVALLIADLQHRRALNSLRADCSDLPFSTSGVTGTLIMILGVLAFLAALVRW